MEESYHKIGEAGPDHRSGFAAIIGKPNAGKSTLLNALVGEKIAIVSDKPQTTRDRITGIVSADDYQVVFVDTPGVIVPTDRFNEALMFRVREALESLDVLIHLVDTTDREPANERLEELLAGTRVPARFLVMNKTDQLRKVEGVDVVAETAKRLGLEPEHYTQMFAISALTGEGVPELLAATVARLRVGPRYYDPEQLSDRDERFLVAEIVREKVFTNLGAEVPYAIFCETEEFEEKPTKDFIRVTIYVERESQKGIVIGDGGAMLKRIGQEARVDIEQLTGRGAYLELWVKVRKNWRKKEFDLNQFGFKARGKNSDAKAQRRKEKRK